METIAGSTVLVLAMLVALAFYFRLKITDLQRRLVSLERVEAKLDLLLEHGGMRYEPLGGSTDIEDALKGGEKVRAVSLYRAANGCTLAEAKAAIERAQRP
jgi:ribosomal protein L7/L12